MEGSQPAAGERSPAPPEGAQGLPLRRSVAGATGDAQQTESRDELLKEAAKLLTLSALVREILRNDDPPATAQRRPRRGRRPRKLAMPATRRLIFGEGEFAQTDPEAADAPAPAPSQPLELIPADERSPGAEGKTCAGVAEPAAAAASPAPVWRWPAELAGRAAAAERPTGQTGGALSTEERLSLFAGGSASATLAARRRRRPAGRCEDSRPAGGEQCAASPPCDKLERRGKRSPCKERKQRRHGCCGSRPAAENDVRVETGL